MRAGFNGGRAACGRDPYSALGVPQGAAEAELKAAFRRRARALHPDVNTSDPDAGEKFKELVAAYELLCDPVRRAAYDRDPDRNGHAAWTASRNGQARRTRPPPPQVWTAARAVEVNDRVGGARRWRGRAPKLDRVIVSPDLGRLATHRGGAVHLWDAMSGRGVASSRNDEGGITWLDFSPDGRWLITHGVRGTVMWDAANGREIERFNLERPRDLTFSSDGRRLATVVETLAQVSDAESGRELASIPHEAAVLSVALSGDGKRLATGARDTTARVWELGSRRAVAAMQHDKPVVGMALSADGRVLASSTTVARSGWTPSAVHIWDVESECELARLQHRCWVDQMAFSPDGQRLATDSNGRLQLWDLGAGRQLIGLDTLVSSAVVFSPDGRWLAAGSSRDVYVLDSRTGHVLARLAHAADVASVAIGSDGAEMATCSFDRSGHEAGGVTVRLWERAEGRAWHGRLS